MNFRVVSFPLVFGAVALSSAGLVPSRFLLHFQSAADEAVEIDTLAAITEARVGSRTVGGATYETDIQDLTPGHGGIITGEKAWSNNVASAFSLGFVTATRTLTWTVGSTTLVQALASNQVFTDAFIRGFAQESNNLQTHLSGLALTKDFGSGVETRSLQNSAFDVPNSPVDGSAVHIYGGSVANTFDWTITGNVAFEWVNPGVALNSRNSMQIKLGTGHYQAVPEPATMAVLGLGALGLLRRRRKA